MIRKLQFLFVILFSWGTNIIFGQAVYHVKVSSFKFDPAELSVQPGDTVIWTNTGGNHNVNGTQTTFPDNPESFGLSVGEGWTYSFVFHTSGTYHYQCDPHASFGMTGVITVIGEHPDINETTHAENEVRIFPNPALGTLNISGLTVRNQEPVDIVINNITGETVLHNEMIIHQDIPLTINILDLLPGMYLLQVSNESEQYSTKFIKR